MNALRQLPVSQASPGYKSRFEGFRVGSDFYAEEDAIERMIMREQTHHVKNSEKRVLARKNLERKLKSQDLARKLKAILVKKVRGL